MLIKEITVILFCGDLAFIGIGLGPRFTGRY